MPSKFEYKLFSEIDVNDRFFDPLKLDYSEFADEWFPKGISEGRKAYVFYDEKGLGSFIALKQENEPLELTDKIIPACSRIKISTLRIAERFRGQRLGEGAIGLTLWAWQKSKCEEIYITAFPTHSDLIQQLERFGFSDIGCNKRGEHIFLRSRKHIDFSDPYKAFPFINPSFPKGGYLFLEAEYHDTLFPYSELKNTPQEQLEMDAANGVSKIYVGNQWAVHYQIGEPIFIYRKFSGDTGKRYKSCLTSFCVVTDIIAVKRSGRHLMSFDEFFNILRNKTVFTQQKLEEMFQNDKNVTLISLLYCGYFGSGNNINMDWLDKNHLWSSQNQYPAEKKLTPEECKKIWDKGNTNLDDIFGR